MAHGAAPGGVAHCPSAGLEGGLAHLRIGWRQAATRPGSRRMGDVARFAARAAVPHGGASGATAALGRAVGPGAAGRDVTARYHMAEDGGRRSAREATAAPK